MNRKLFFTLLLVLVTGFSFVQEMHASTPLPGGPCDFFFRQNGVNVSSVCQGSGTVQCFTSTSPANFSATPAGLVFVSTTTGDIDANSSSPGTYTVTNTNSGGNTCTYTRQITILAPDDASFQYPNQNICKNQPNPIPTVATSGGTFTAPSNVAINPATGEIDIFSSVVGGPYTITYTTNGPCPASDDLVIVIRNADDPAFSYSASSYCQDLADPLPVIAGDTGGTFSALPAGMTLNASSGKIDLSGSVPGTYSVTYTTSGPCPASQDVIVTINPVDSAAIDYSGNPYCGNETTNPVPTFSGVTGGVFSSSCSGLALDTITGEINLAASTPGSCEVTYTTTGICPAMVTDSVTIFAPPPAPSLVQNNLDVTCGCSGVEYEWFLNGTPEDTTFTDLFTPSGAGDVWMIITDANGCKNISDTLAYTAVGIFESLPSREAKVYPNPGEGKFMIELGNAPAGEFSLTLSDVTGRMLQSVQQWHYQGQAQVFDLQGLPEGLYFLRLHNSNEVFVAKVQIQR